MQESNQKPTRTRINWASLIYQPCYSHVLKYFKKCLAQKKFFRKDKKGNVVRLSIQRCAYYAFQHFYSKSLINIIREYPLSQGEVHKEWLVTTQN